MGVLMVIPLSQMHIFPHCSLLTSSFVFVLCLDLFIPHTFKINQSHEILVQPSGNITTSCRTDEIMCLSDGRCIESYKYCNNVIDCEDGSDEDCSGVLYIFLFISHFNDKLIQLKREFFYLKEEIK